MDIGIYSFLAIYKANTAHAYSPFTLDTHGQWENPKKPSCRGILARTARISRSPDS